MSVSVKLDVLRRAQADLVRALQEETFCEDLQPPRAAFGWDEQQLRDYFDKGGVADDVGTLSDDASASARTPPETGPAPTRGRPILLALGDSLTEFGHHLCDPTWDKKAPFASEVLQRAGVDVPVPEHGPGWLALLQRDFQWRTSCDVLNRGFSGCTSRLLLRALPEILGSVRTSDVRVCTLMLGANDHCSVGEQAVPLEEFAANMSQLVEALRAALPPECHLLLISPGRINKEKWSAHIDQATGGRVDGSSRGAAPALEQYAKAALQVASAPRVQSLNLMHDMRYKLADYHAAEHPDGYHWSAKVNRFVYKQVREKLEEVGLSPVQMAPHRPSAIAEALPFGNDGDGRLARRAARPR